MVDVEECKENQIAPTPRAVPMEIVLAGMESEWYHLQECNMDPENTDAQNDYLRRLIAITLEDARKYNASKGLLVTLGTAAPADEMVIEQPTIVLGCIAASGSAWHHAEEVAPRPVAVGSNSAWHNAIVAGRQFVFSTTADE